MSRNVLFEELAELVKETYTPRPSENLKYIGLEHINQQNLRLNGVGESKGLESNKYRFKSGDILFGKLRPYFRKVVRPDFDGVCSTDIWVLRAKDGVDPDYLFYLVASEKFINASNGASTGTRMPRADWKHISRVSWTIPDYPYQQQAGKLLRTLDRKIELNRQMNETLKQIGHALYRHYFIANPETKKWATANISDLGKVITGKTPSKTKNEYYGNDVPFLKVPDMHEQNIIIDTADSLSKLGADSQKNKYIPKWSTCVSCIATVGVVSLAGETMQTNQQINSIIPRSNKYRFFNYYTMLEKSKTLRNLASGGSATPNLNKSQFEKIKVVLPPPDLLIKFNSAAEGLFERIDLNTRETQTLISLRETLLSRLISGKLII